MRTTFHPQLVNDPFGDPALYVDCLFQKRALLFDLGDIRALPPKKLLRISHVFVSHAHMDHFMGFDWLLRICLGRDRAMQLFGPPGFLEQVEHKLAAYTWNLVHNYDTDFTLHVTEVAPGIHARRATFRCRAAFQREDEVEFTPSDVLVDEDFFRVRTTLLDHRTPCLAFALEEKTHANIWKNRLLEAGLAPGPWLQEAKRAVLGGVPDETTIMAAWRENGQTLEKPIALGELRRDIVRLVPGQKIVYVTDAVSRRVQKFTGTGTYLTQWGSLGSGDGQFNHPVGVVTDAVYHAENARKITALALDADLLFIESTFLDEHKERALEKRHLTARQAGELARAANAKQVVPFHFSPIYREEEQRIYEELALAFRG
jgi:ribonuclease Z